MYIKRCVGSLVQIGVLYLVSLVSFDNVTLAFRTPIIKDRELKGPVNFIKSGRKGFKLLDSLETRGIQTQIEEDFQPSSRKVVPGCNVHPKFCLGSFSIFDIELLEGFSKLSGDLRVKTLYYMSLLTKLGFRLAEFGALRTTHRDMDPRQEIKGPKLKTFDDFFFANTLGNGFADSSLSLIKRMFDQSLENGGEEDFMSRLSQEEIETFEVKDLISDIPLNKGSREDLMAFMEEEVLGSANLPSPLSMVPSNWRYHPNCESVEMTLRLTEIDHSLRIKFRLYPGARPFVIDHGLLLLAPLPTKTPVSGELKNKPIRLAQVKVRPYKYRMLYQPIQPCPENEKNLFISIDGFLREKFNLLFKLLETLDSNLPAGDIPAKPGLDAKLLDKSENDMALNVKLIQVNLESKLQLLIPLLTYVDLENGMSYLCHPGIPIEASPNKVWSINENSYFMYNRRFIPRQYRNAGFFSSQNVRFTDQDVLKLLSQYLDFKKLLHNTDPGGPPPPGSPLWSQDLTFERIQGPQPPPSQKDTPQNKADIYCVNGKRRMIYKNQSSAIFVNLLV